MHEAYEKYPVKLDNVRACVTELLQDGPLWLDDKGRYFVSSREEELPLVRFHAPPIFPIPEGVTTAEQYLAALPETLGGMLVILVQAGATSMGIWQGETLLRHKVIKKYVTRGTGRAQTTYLKTRGKSRYGSRLRLQNAKLHLIETNEKMWEWWEEFGAPDHIFYSCTSRMWPELFNADPVPPFDKQHKCFKIGMDVRKPGHEELLKVRRFLEWGAVYRRQPQAALS